MERIGLWIYKSVEEGFMAIQSGLIYFLT